MNHDRAHQLARLRGLVLQAERGELDKDFTAAVEAGCDVAPLREAMIRRIRQLADAIESGEG